MAFGAPVCAELNMPITSSESMLCVRADDVGNCADVITKIYKEYVDNIFLPYIMKNLESASRVDIGFDVYISDSLKAGTRESRGCGVRRRVLSSVLLPGNWHSFLRVNDNNTELFQYIAQRAIEKIDLQGKILVITNGNKVISIPHNKNATNLEVCSHVEADTRILLHLADEAQEGIDKILIRTTDTDVLVLAIASFQSTEVREIWVALGTGKHFKYVPAHQIASHLGPSKSRPLPAFHAFTGCDTFSFFNN